MKNFSLKSTFAFALLAIAGVTFLGSGNKAFAAVNDAQYISAFNPNPSVCTSMVVDRSLNPGNLAGGGALSANTIYVLPAGTYAIAGNIDMETCSVFVADGDTAGNVIFNFAGGTYISADGKNDFAIAGYDTTHRIVISGPASPAGIVIQNSTGAKVIYTTLTGFSVWAGIGVYNTTASTISYNIMTYNKDGINVQNSANNTFSHNTITNNSDHGMRLQAGSNGNTISSNTVSNNTNYGMLLEGVTNNMVSSNTINNQSLGIGLALSSNSNESNTVSNNTISSNYIGLYVDAAKSNTFTSNNISSNISWGVNLVNAASGNVFTSDTISSNTNINVYLSNAHSNEFKNTIIQNSARGIDLTNSNYNTFSGANVASNTEGAILTTSSNNTFKLTNNTNGISLYGGSNANNILNTQVVGQNNIGIYNGSNNVITGGLFAAASTTSTAVNISLKNNQATPTYDVTGAGLSGTYAGSMSGVTQTLAIELTAGNGTKNILVTYNNDNKQYDTITLGTVTPPGGGGGGGGGGGVIPTCISSQLVCVDGLRALAPGASCQGGNLGQACSLPGTGTGRGPYTGGSIAGSTYSDELNTAYLRAYSRGITTMPTIQQANMYGNLIRSHMAKMMSNFAISVAGRTPNTSLECNFADISNESSELRFYIKLSCQLGLMGLKADGTPDISFNPRGEVTRAQFGTVLSRLIRGDTYNGGTPYYAPHLTALQQEGIMTQIQNPTTRKELRGRVMLMLQRTYEGGYLE